MVTRRNQRQVLRDAAHAYATAGWPIFPLRPGTKRPATPNHTADNCNGTDPRCAWNGHTGWEQRATTDHGRIDRAWDQHPYGIGIATGPARLVVVDLDVAKTAIGVNGVQALRTIEEHHGQELPATFTVATPSGGRHLYYADPTGDSHGNTTSRVGPRIDTRAAGGYVVAPPSITPVGSYEVIDDHPPVELPSWFSQLLDKPPRGGRAGANKPSIKARQAPAKRVSRYVAAAIAGEQRRIAQAPAGQRNHILFCASVAIGQLVGANALETAQAEQLLDDAAQSHVAAGAYSTSQARQTIASGLRRGVTEPRQLPTATYTRTNR